MGDEPISYERDNSCPGSLWDSGLQPGYIHLTFADIEKGNNWTSGMPEPPNQVFTLDFVSCNSFDYIVSPWNAFFDIESGSFVVGLALLPGLTFFDCEYPDEEGVWEENVMTDVNSIFHSGSVRATLFLDSDPVPASWDPSTLLGIPRQDGYLAEELPSTDYSRYLRYVNNSNGSNFKMIGDF